MWILFRKQPLFNCFIGLKDPRVGGRCLYPLINIVMITLCGLICGADNWKAIELFAKKRQRWLKKFLDLSHGIPSHYTLARVFSLIDSQHLQFCFMNWVSQIMELLEDDIIAIDGKTLRGSSHKSGDKKAVHVLNAFSARKKITLGETKVPDKTNEIKGIPILLNQLNLTKTIITIDAMGTQKGIANLIRKKQSHYVLALKKNHKRFYRKVDRLFNRADELNLKGMVYRRWSDRNYDHGRLEDREYTILPMMYLFQYKKTWKDLSIFIRVKSKRETKAGIEESVRYYISSIPYKKYHKAGQAIRQHWSIENSLHWKLDIGMNEDRCQIYRGRAAENLATIRKIVLFLLQDENTSHQGIAMKRLQAALSTTYLRKVVCF
jgi:predicted transposase YbfD/YdcC